MRESLRVGIFSESFQPVQNGVTTSVLTLVSGLRALRHRVWIFAPAHQQQREPETNVVRFPSFVSAFNPEYPVAVPFLPGITLLTHFERLRLDVVHTHTPFVLGLTGANLAVRHKLPLISTFHTLYSQYTHYLPLLPDSVTHSVLDYYLPWYYNRCDAVVCPSQVAADCLTRVGVDRPIHVIPTGIPLPPADAVSEAARQRKRAELCLAADTPVAMYAGRLAQEKNIGWLLRAFATVRTRMPKAVLIIAGGGPNAEELAAEAQALCPPDTVQFLGPVPRSEMDALYAAADVFCFPSPSETQGLVIGEARAAGLPSVVIDAGGAPETVRDGVDGFRVPFGDVEQFAARTVQVLEGQELRARLRENALQYAREFTPDRMVQRIVDAYAQAIERAPESH